MIYRRPRVHTLGYEKAVLMGRRSGIWRIGWHSERALERHWLFKP
jgi:hypothetical protein